MTPPPIGFAVIYRWKLHAEREASFRDAWERVTLLLREHRGALGSRLHRAADGWWVAYAQWPSRDAWAASREAESIDPAAGATMAEAILESDDPILLQPVLDHLHDGPMA